LFYRDNLGKLRKKYVKRGALDQKRAELAGRKAAFAAQKTFLHALKTAIPQKRERHYDLLTSIGRSSRMIDRVFGTALQQGRNDKGRFEKQ
jgi:hypothetical protein